MIGEAGRPLQADRRDGLRGGARGSQVDQHLPGAVRLALPDGGELAGVDVAFSPAFSRYS